MSIETVPQNCPECGHLTIEHWECGCLHADIEAHADPEDPDRPEVVCACTLPGPGGMHEGQLVTPGIRPR